MRRKFLNWLMFSLLAASATIAAEYHAVPVDDIEVPDGLEVTIWAQSPMLFNPTNIDTDADGRIWVAEGVNYRRAIHRPDRARSSPRSGRRAAHRARSGGSGCDLGGSVA